MNLTARFPLRFLFGSVLAASMVPASLAAQPLTPAEKGYASVNGLRLYYEIHGKPQPNMPPLVLLHGGGDTIQTSFSHLLPLLAARRQVIAFEQQGFGHTADIPDRPFSFTQSADDTVALLRHLKIPQADLCGFSNGATIALQVAIRNPEVVRRLVLISALYRRDGADDAFWNGFNGAKLEMMPAELKEAYRATSPHPDKLQSFFDKCVERMKTFQDIPDDQMRAITAPTLVIAGDHDVVRVEHAVATYRILPKATLAIVPATDHMHLTARVEALEPALTPFLDAK